MEMDGHTVNSAILNFLINDVKDNMDPNTHEVIFKCRQALLYYTLRMLKLTPEDEANNTENTIEIKNKNEVYTILNLYKDK